MKGMDIIVKVLILCDHYPISPRVKKVRASLIKIYPNSNIKVFAWNRSNKDVTEWYVSTFNQDIGYGNKLYKLLNMIKFIKSSKNFIDEFKPDYIHAIDMEMLITSKITSKASKIIYEVYDIKFFHNKILNWMREKIEFHIIKKDIHAMVLASPYFGIYYKSNDVKEIKTIVMNNKPSKDLSIKTKNNYMDNYSALLSDKIVIGFIGTIRYKNILVNLIDACTRFDNLVILLAGDGPSSDYIKNYIKRNSLQRKIIMTGRYNVEDLESIYGVCDYVWAAYPSENLNVKYAISNKFFESIIYRKKVIVSKNTMLGDYVNKTNMGFTVNPYDVEQISAFLRTLNKYYEIDNNFILENGEYWEDEEDRLLGVFGK